MKKILLKTDQNHPAIKAYREAMEKGRSMSSKALCSQCGKLRTHGCPIQPLEIPNLEQYRKTPSHTHYVRLAEKINELINKQKTK